MPSMQKQIAVKQLQDKLAKSQSVVFAKYSGLNVIQQQKLRSMVREAGGEIAITRNRLMNIALGKPEGFAETLQDQLLTLFSYVDPVSPVKALYTFIKDNELPLVKAGFMDGKPMSVEQVDALSKMATKNEMIATLLRTIKGPASGLRNVLAASTQNLVFALQAIATKKENQA